MASELEAAIVALEKAEYANDQYGGPGNEALLVNARARLTRAKRKLEEAK